MNNNTKKQYWRKPLTADRLTAPSGSIHITKDRCKGCGFCVEFCPQKVLVMSEEFNIKDYHAPVVIKEKDCLICHLCELLCPEFAIYVTQKHDEVMNE